MIEEFYLNIIGLVDKLEDTFGDDKSLMDITLIQTCLVR